MAYRMPVLKILYDPFGELEGQEELAEEVLEYLYFCHKDHGQSYMEAYKPGAPDEGWGYLEPLTAADDALENIKCNFCDELIEFDPAKHGRD